MFVYAPMLFVHPLQFACTKYASAYYNHLMVDQFLFHNKCQLLPKLLLLNPDSKKVVFTTIMRK